VLHCRRRPRSALADYAPPSLHPNNMTPVLMSLLTHAPRMPRRSLRIGLQPGIMTRGPPQFAKSLNTPTLANCWELSHDVCGVPGKSYSSLTKFLKSTQCDMCRHQQDRGGCLAEIAKKQRAPDAMPLSERRVGSADKTHLQGTLGAAARVGSESAQSSK
jgi:hypothetical protein